MQNMIKSTSELLEHLNREKSQQNVARLGKLFTTKKSYYFYDTGTGKIAQFEKSVYDVLKQLFEDDSYLLNMDILDDPEVSDFFIASVREHLFQVPKIEMLYQRGHYEELSEQLNGNIQQIILEVTGRCNLRCRYCIYNESYSENRDFNNEDMSWDTAKAAIDYLALHGAEKVAIGFYGGEPLLNYKLIKQCIEYARTKLTNKKVTYSFTTNCTLLTEEMANFFSTIDGMAIMCSIDGPKDVHDEYRRDIHNDGSFDLAIRGLKILVSAFEHKMSYNSGSSISINGVFTPPFTIEKAKRIYEFFHNLDWLPHNVNIQFEPARPGSIQPSDMQIVDQDLAENPMWSLGKNAYLFETLPSQDNLKDRMYISAIQTSLLNIHKRFISDLPLENFPFNGCCVPGARRLYINTSGNLYLCERIENSPSIGNITTGIDIQTVRKKYVAEYSEHSTEDCKSCWALRLCRVCYAECYNDRGVDMAEKQSVCTGTKNTLEASLSLYHQILEECPQKLAELNSLNTV